MSLAYARPGDSTDYIWGVLDIVPITDFPDIRMRCAIHSASSGSVMVIPRENKLVRLYIQLTTTEKIGEGGAKADRSKITPQVILESAQRIMAPYKITYRKLDWVCYSAGNFDIVWPTNGCYNSGQPIRSGRGWEPILLCTNECSWLGMVS